ncbi:unnamed protein product [Eruca vesicaria subsp. sativa]|uniref:Leucine-rich repeat-containing N-terminal plant-type domain-containing protein n=1 Tax=Eruca vesicaria subsp. sativa TaxID=29727 RepID=A0ABC8KBP3_ERUVS|nr:unnamed protein product [Eruca vesicaria subsp. sativa]
MDPDERLSNWVFGNYSEGYICNFSGVKCWGSEQNRVLSIDLGGYGLEGEFPSGVKVCSSMESLNLTGNNLSDTIPSDVFSFIPYLVTLDLSHNIFSVSSPRLQNFSVAHNDLDGPIPELTNGSNFLWSFEDNPYLCGFPLDPCHDSFYSMAIVAANVSAAALFPVGACFGWFYVGKKQKTTG